MDISTQLLEDARKRSTANREVVTNLIYGSSELAKQVKEFHKRCAEIPAIQVPIDFYNWSRKQQILSRAGSYVELTRLMDGKPDDMDNYLAPILYVPQPNYFGVHFGMVVPALKILGSDAQNKEFYDDFISLKKSACYAQTEIAHGSDVQGLLTTATFDKKTNEFIIHSPSIEAIKFWPGDLGLLANHALVFAQLIVDGQNHGTQAFIVPIRDFNTHKPLPGVVVGDIGPKMGYASKDNGFLQLNNVRIPNFNMLARYIQVTADGKVIRQGNPKISYSSMMIMRLLIVYVYSFQAAVSMVIALRYSISRTQFRNDVGVENSVLAYQTQQDKLFPLLANLYSVIFTARKVQELVRDNFNRVQQKNDFSKLDVCHAILSGTKANFTYFVIDCSEWCRLSCGGHGFAHYSGLPAIYFENVPNATLEGENQIMYLQLARYLLKMLKHSAKDASKIPDQFAIFKNINHYLQFKLKEFHVDHLETLIASQAIHQISRTANKMVKLLGEGKDAKAIWDYDIGTDLYKSGAYFIELYKLQCFKNTISTVQDQKTATALTQLLQLHAIQLIITDPSVLIQCSIIDPEVLKQMREYKNVLLAQISENAIVFADAFELSDEALRTTIGCYDGRPYERMYDWAVNHNSVNKIDIGRIVNPLKNIKLKSKL